MEIVMRNEVIYDFLLRIDQLPLRNYFIGAGCITQTIWNDLSGYPLCHGIKDVDVVYYDANDITSEGEAGIRTMLADAFPDFPLKLDVKNQARVHMWYKERFGYEIPPYSSLESAIDTWPTTATALGLRIVKDEWQLYAPFGLADLFNRVVRPNKIQITQQIYEKKVNQWIAIWNELIIVPWLQSGEYADG